MICTTALLSVCRKALLDGLVSGLHLQVLGASESQVVPQAAGLEFTFLLFNVKTMMLGHEMLSPFQKN